ncbi:hypothetical protein D3C73_1225910 [compost metagenome]
MLGFVSMSAAVSEPTAAFKASRSTMPCGVEGIVTVVRPAADALAGFVPWEESGTMTFVRSSPRASW